MATLTLTYDTGNITLADLSDNVALGLNYDSLKIEGETKAQFNKRMVRNFVIDAYRQGKRIAAIQAAEAGIVDLPLT